MSDQDQEIYATLVEIKQEPTELYKILKFESLVSGGGEAKQVIAEGYVLLNGEVETQKRKKVYAGDLICFNDQYYQVAIKGETSEYEFIEQPDKTETYPTQASDTQINTAELNPFNEKVEEKSIVSKKQSMTEKQPGNTKKKRKPISF